MPTIDIKIPYVATRLSIDISTVLTVPDIANPRVSIIACRVYILVVTSSYLLLFL